MNPLLLLLALVQGLREPDPPPGLVLVPGGRTAIGIGVKDLERLLASDRALQEYAGSLSAETPRHELRLPSFHLMATEVTNEQYAAYVRAADVRPPEHWGDAAIRAGAQLFFEDHERARAAALAEGRAAPEPPAFDRRAWWEANWRSSPWRIPEGEERHPVVFVDHDDARGYARWAGLRLPSEFEYQRAVRGGSERAYPWGNDWDDERYAATILARKKSGARPVASFPAGASREGIHDLAGNVWEWTSSPYVAYPGYAPRMYELGFGSKARTVNAVADFNPAQRVVVGGSFQNNALMARATARRAADPEQATDALGFRCAASARPGVDQARAILDDELTANLRPLEGGEVVAYEPEETVAWERWDHAAPEGDPPPRGYAVITRYRHVLWTPVRELRATDEGAFERASVEEGPVALGFLSANVALEEPPLAPGVYLVSYRARGRPRPGSASVRRGAPVEETLALDVERDHLIFTALDTRPVLARELHVGYGNLREGRVAASADGGELVFELCVRSRTTLKGFLLSLPVRIAAGEER